MKSPINRLLSLLTVNFFASAISLYLTLRLANYLGPGDFGTYSYVLVIGSVLSIIVNFGTDQLASLTNIKIKAVKLTVELIILLRLILTIICFFAVWIFYFSNLSMIICVSSLMIANLNMSFLYEIGARQVRYSKICLGERIVYVCLVLLAINFNLASIKNIFLLYFLSGLLSLFVQYRDNKKVINICNTELLRTHRDVVSNHIPIVMIALSSFVFGGFSRLILEQHLGVRALGIYSAGWTVVTIGSMYQTQITRLYRPEIIKYVHTHDMKNICKVLYSYFKLSTAPLSLASLVVIFFPNYIINLVYSKEYAEVAKILPIFGAYILVVNLIGVIEIMWVGLNKNNLFMCIHLIFGSSLILFLYFFSLDYKLYNFALTTLVGHLLLTLILLLVWIFIFKNCNPKMKSDYDYRF